ncbi:Hypothetical Protein FCC1311_056522 [Hondaea fermentalgiana]|uniref:Selenoprotein F n=1 Tax=Hondaea fermentalgiana TaxID=2315210 RepID=A0A2R5GMA9_9STRA|nr:Hypothetical Protein FCC1311_056522 [Hondaea fermentalgiana]|eukprot:GBG29431.1 Hypothetical Protein FCC1311_056522 [Hondaea fermentalgiana]
MRAFGRAAIVAALAAAAVGLVHAEADASLCAEAGFDVGDLHCATCVRLAEAVGDDDTAAKVVEDCKRCCTDASTADEDDDAAHADGAQAIASAELLVDRFRIAGFPAVADFINKKSARFGDALMVTDRFARWPELILRNADGDAVRRIDVRGWDADQMEDFLAHKLSAVSA